MNNAVHFLKLTLPDTDVKTKEYLCILDDEIHNSDKIITDLLEFSRTKSIDKKHITVDQLVQGVLKRYPAPENISVEIDLAPDLPQIYVDPRHIEQVLGNLVVNAYQAMPPPVSDPPPSVPPDPSTSLRTGGGETGGVLTVSAKGDETQVEVTISDTGVGIPPENLKKIFEPLFTTKAKGIGLGLAVSQKLAEANGGRIEVQSKPGTGSVFTLHLPIFKESP
jgi:signal transduction histidine kinase